MAKGVAHAGKGKSLSSGEANENERRGWDEKTYRQKNKRPFNNYDWSRCGLNFEIVDGKIVPLGSQTTSLYSRYMDMLKNLGFRQYKTGASNQQHTYVELILSGSTERMQQIAFGNQKVDFTRNPQEWKNWGVSRTKGIEQWALDCYMFVCDKYGADNLIGFEVHLDEKEPHVHVNIVPTALMQQRGRISGYHKVDADGKPVTYTKGKHVGEVIKISESKYKALSEDKQQEYRPNERETVRTISYSTYFGRTLAERSQKLSELHDDYYDQVGRKWGLDRGDIWALLPEEERRKRKHRTKQQAFDEEQANKAKEKAIVEKDTVTKEVEELKELRDLNQATITEQQAIKDAAQRDLDLINKVRYLIEEKVGNYVHTFPDVKMSVTKDIREKLISPMKNHMRIITSVNPPMSLDELQRVVEEELEKVIKDKGMFLSKEDRNKRGKAIITDMTTILMMAVGEKQKSEILDAQGKLYKSIRQEMADAVNKALKYDDLQKEGVTDSHQARQLKESASRTEATEDLLEFAWPGVTKAKNVLIDPNLDDHRMTDLQRNDVQSILQDVKDHPEYRLKDMQRLLKYASSFRKVPLSTQAEALMLSTDKAITYIKDNLGCDFLDGAKNMVGTIGEQIEKPVEAINQIAATAACLFFGFVDAATTISVGGGGGGGQDTGGWRGRKDDENDRQYATRCLLGAAQMRMPRGKKTGQSR